MLDTVSMLVDEFENADSVWFLVKPNYRIVHFNKKAAANSIAFHNKEISYGASILDYARDTSNQIDSEFIRCFGKSATGQVIQQEQEIIYRSARIWTKTTYTPVYDQGTLHGISILVEDIANERTL